MTRSNAVLGLCFLALLGPAVWAEPAAVKPSRQWGEVVNDPKLAKLAPAGGLVVDQAAFAKLWKAWGARGAAPEIDFARNFVVVEVATGGPNVPRTSFTLDEGNLGWVSFSTLIGGDAFGYSLSVIPREGVKTAKGKPVPKKSE